MVSARAWLRSAAVVLGLVSSARALLDALDTPFVPGHIHEILEEDNPNGGIVFKVKVTAVCEPGLHDCNFLLLDSNHRTFDLADVNQCANPLDKFKDPRQLTWVLVLSVFVAAALAFGIGANDAANSLGTAVGSGALPLFWACLFGGFMEWAGATSLGYGVASTIRKGVASTTAADCWACGYCDTRMPLFMIAMMSALFASAIFMGLATFTAMPVSTTHTIVGAVVGATVMGTGWRCLNWSFAQGGLFAILASWLISPLASGLGAGVVFVILRQAVFKQKDPTKAAIISVPILFATSTWLLIFLILVKSPITGRIPWKWAALGGFGAAGVVGGLVLAFMVPRMRDNLPSASAIRQLADPDMEGASGGRRKTLHLEPHVAKISVREAEEERHPDEVGLDSVTKKVVVPEVSARITSEWSQHLKETHARLQSLAERDAIWCFRYLLTYQALLESFSHGANDTANATGPFTAVYSLYMEGNEACNQSATPWYIMAAGGFFVALGVNTYGYKVMKTIGSELTDVNFFRGYCIEVASTFTVVICTVLNLPVSTTHAQVGAIIFVGVLAFGWHDVQWIMLARIVIAWCVTLPTSAGIAALCMYMFQLAVKI